MDYTCILGVLHKCNRIEDADDLIKIWEESVS